MDPQHECGILRGVGRARRIRAYSLRKNTVDAPVNRANGLECPLTRNVVAEGKREHCVHGLIQARRCGVWRAAKAAVIEDAGRHERMRELEQDGARPSQQNDPLCS